MKKRSVSIFMLIAYCAVLVKIMVFKDLPIIRIGSLRFSFGGTHAGPPNLVPFRTILPYLLGDKGLVIAGINLLGNIVLLVPIGFLLPFVYRSITWKLALVFAVAAGFIIEGMQVWLHVGIFDIDDVILNGLGVMIGYWVFRTFATMTSPVRNKTILVTGVTVLVVVIAGSMALYFVPVDQKHRLPELSEAVFETDKVDSSHGIRDVRTGQGVDPCGGTGGTGRIVSVGTGSITIRLHDNTNAVINITSHTILRNSAGPITKDNLQIGDGVTVVVDEGRNGARIGLAILVCNVAGGESVR